MGDWWDHVKAASSRGDGVNQSGNIDITNAPVKIGGVSSFASGADRVLLRFQTDASENRTYVYNGPGAALQLAAADVPKPRATVRVDEGDSAKMTFALVDTASYYWARQDGAVNVQDFGAIPDADRGADGTFSGTDNSAAFQRAVDFCIRNPNRQLFIPAGYYLIAQSIIVNIPKGTACLHIFGDTVRDTYLISMIPRPPASPPDPMAPPPPDSKDWPIFALQGMGNSIIRRIHFFGRNDWMEQFEKKWKMEHPPEEPPPVVAMMLDDSVFVVNECRDKQNSPHAAIVIDPYSPATNSVLPPSAPPDGGYPGDEHQGCYLDPGAPSSNVLIEDCVFDYFVVGVMIAPRGYQGNADNITVRNCQFGSNKVALAIGGDQSRNVVIYNFNVAGARCAIDCRTYGRVVDPSNPGKGDTAAQGEPPAIHGADIAQVKYLFNMTIERGLTVQALYCENTLSMGFIYGISPAATMIFHACTFNFAQASAERGFMTAPTIDCHLLSTPPVRFEGCSFTSQTGSGGSFGQSSLGPDEKRNDVRNGTQPLVFFNDGALTFSSCGFQNNGYALRPDVVSPNFLDPESSKAASLLIGFANFRLVRFEDSILLDPRRSQGGFVPSAASRLASVYHVDGMGQGPPDRFDELKLNLVPSGALIMYVENHVPDDQNASRLLRVASHREFPVARDQSGLPTEVYVSIHEDEVDGRVATFYTGTAGILKPGDLVYDNTVWAWNDDPLAPRVKEDFRSNSPHGGGVLGMVIKVVPRVRLGSVSDHVTLAFIPERYELLPAPATLTMKLMVRTYGRFHSPAYGWSENGFPPEPINPAQIKVSNPAAWRVGDRIWAKGYILPGTFVVGVNANVLTLSRGVIKPLPSAVPGKSVALTDAPVYSHVGQMFDM
jgi:hypothetical protein